MKRVLLTMAVAAFLVASVNTADAGHWQGAKNTDTDTTVESRIGFKVDAPNLIKLTKNSSIGIEAGKDIVWWQKNDGRGFTDSNKGWFSFLKFTWSGIFFDFTKKK